MTKTQAKKKIKELVDEYRSIEKRDEVGLYNEETTKQRFIQPLFKALGWDFRKGVWLEEKVSKDRVDYAFKLNNITKFFVEAKPLRADLNNPEYIRKAINYSWLDPDVIKVGDRWRMYTGEVERNITISATSTDGLNFEKEGIAFQGGAVPDVFYKDGLYYLFTAGINIATSNDGTSFTKTANSFRSNLGMITADPSVIKLKDGSYMMLYKTQEGKPGMMKP